jgi:hypothetical protein
VYFNPNQQDFLNTLTELRPGYGFVVQISDPPGPGSTYSFSIEGRPVNQSMSIPLYQDWNLIAYFDEDGISPEEIFADLIEAEELVYVTTYIEDSETGWVYFDPSNPDFLNTLNEMYIGVGYWVKVTFNPNQYPDGYIPFYYDDDYDDGSTPCGADECIVVDPFGEGDFTTIQEAIDASNSEITTDIIIRSGTYVESVDSVAKNNYKLKGEGEVIWLNESNAHFTVYQCSIDTNGDLRVFLTEYNATRLSIL